MMIRHALPIAAIAIAATAALASPATAGGSPCCCAAPCVVAVPEPAPVVVYKPYRMPRVYIVDQGPVYSGPGIYTNPTVMGPPRATRYPYIGHRGYPSHLPPYVEPLRSRAEYLPPQRAVRNSYK